MKKKISWMAVLVMAMLVIACGDNCKPYPEPLDCDIMSVGPGWAKVNTHTHTYLSDGSLSPEDVRKWYVDNCYDALVITDHGKWYDSPAPDILIIPGMELTSGGDYTLLDYGDISILAHPQRLFSYNLETISDKISTYIFEVYNGGDSPYDLTPNEEIWDAVLSSGNVLYGVAADDAHFNCRTKPGYGWIVAKVDDTTQASIINAIVSGDFYSSTGVYLSDYRASGDYIMDVDMNKTRADSCDFEIIITGMFQRGKVTCTKSNGDLIHAWGQPTRI